MRQLFISSLGALEFSLDGQPLDAFDYAKVRALLVLLAMQPRQAYTRAALCALLWPDATERSARTSLSQALTRLRKAIPVAPDEPLLITTTQDVQLNPECDVESVLDARRFEQILDEAEAHPRRAWKTCARCAERLNEATALYQGDFLRDFSLPDSAPFEEWSQALRERLRQRAITAHERLARRAEWCGDWECAIQHAQRQVKLDPLNEACHRNLMRLLALNDQVPAAHHQYEMLRQRLDAELGVEPEPATQQIYAAISDADAMLRRDVAPVSQLPKQPTALIGRDDDVRTVCELMREGDARLITLTGPGGVGKTRLALRVADELRYDYLDGAYFVDLAPITDPTLVNAVVADALGLRDRSPDAVLSHLSRLDALLVLDNVEHVLDAAPFVADLLVQCPGIAILATSRIALRIRAERVVPLAPLAVPLAGADADEVSHASAVQLFVERARAIQPAFTLTPDNMTDVATICRQLDGLPLALELVATKAEALAASDIVRRLTPSLPALSDGPRDLPERQQTMRDAIAWSTRLLREPEQRLFAHLAVFAGSFDEAAVRAVCPHAECDLSALVRASLIQSVEAGRWRMLEPIREFAEEMLARKEDAARVRASHAAHFSAVAQTARDALLGPDAPAWMAHLEADHANMQTAIRWAVQTNQPHIALTIGECIFRFWYRRGLWCEGLVLLEQALSLDEALTTTPPAIRSSALRAAGVLAQALGQFEQSDAYNQTAIDIAQRIGDDGLIGAVLHNLGILRRYQGRFEEALACFDRASALLPERMLKHPWQAKADTLLRLGRFEPAKTLYERAQAVNEQIGDEDCLAHTLRGVGEIAWRGGDADTAERLLLENKAICLRLNHDQGLSWTAQQLGNVARLRGAWQAAHEFYAEALERMEKMGDQWGRCDVLVECAHLSAAQGDYARAAHWLGMAQEGRRVLGAKLTPFELNRLDATAQLCARHLGDAALQQALQLGADAWSVRVQPDTPRDDSSR